MCLINNAYWKTVLLLGYAVMDQFSFLGVTKAVYSWSKAEMVRQITHSFRPLNIKAEANMHSNPANIL